MGLLHGEGIKPMTENETSNEIRAVLNTGKTRAFRNNIARINHQGRWINFGIPGQGGSDLIGFHTLTITPEMVGKRVAVFLAVECKSSKGKPTSEQTAFIEYVQSAGGIAGVANSGESALNIITQYKPCL
jgi:hypothetical protein